MTSILRLGGEVSGALIQGIRNDGSAPCMNRCDALSDAPPVRRQILNPFRPGRKVEDSTLTQCLLAAPPNVGGFLYLRVGVICVQSG